MVVVVQRVLLMRKVADDIFLSLYICVCVCIILYASGGEVVLVYQVPSSALEGIPLIAHLESLDEERQPTSQLRSIVFSLWCALTCCETSRRRVSSRDLTPYDPSHIVL